MRRLLYVASLLACSASTPTVPQLTSSQSHPFVTQPVPLAEADTTPTTGTLTDGRVTGDDFSAYRTSEDLLGNIAVAVGGTGSIASSLYADGWRADLVSLDSTVRYNGHATMKYSQPGGSAATPALFVELPTPLTKLWLRAKVRFSPGFTTTGTLTGTANSYKLLGWGWDGADGRGSVEISNTTEYLLYWYLLRSDGSGQTVAGGDPAYAGQISSEWWDSGWYDYIVSWEQTSATSAVSRVWISKDGHPPVLRATTAGTDSAGTIPGVHSIMIGINFNQERTEGQSQALWIGLWEVIDGTQHADPYSLETQVENQIPSVVDSSVSP